MNILYGLLLSIYALLQSYIPSTTYTEGIVGQPSNFLPSKAKTQIDRTVNSLIYRGLFKYDILGIIVPDLAETWTVSADGLTYTIKIKDNQYWTNGKKIMSDDLIYTSFKVSDLTGVATDKVDDLTVRYTLPNKYAPFLNLLTVGVMPSNAEEDKQSIQPISSGNYRVARVDRSGNLIKQIVLVGNKNVGEIKKIAFRFYSNEDELVTAAKAGEINAFVSNKIFEIEGYKDRKYPIQGIYYALIFNLTNEKFKDVALRQRLEKVLPISKIIIEDGILTQGPISRSIFTSKEVLTEKYDDKFTFDMASLDFVITVPLDKTHRETADVITNYWEDKLGVITETKEVEPEKFITEVIEPRNFDVMLYGQEVSRDPDRYVLWHSTQKAAPGLNVSSFEHVRADRALEEGRNELDNEQRVKHYNEFQKVVDEQVPAIFLYHPYVHYYVSKYIEGMGEKYTFTQWDRFLDLNNWKVIKTN